MTKEEAKEIIESECYVFNPLNLDMTTRINTALDVAVETLEQEPMENFESTKDHILKLAGDYKCWDNRLTHDEALELCHMLEQKPCEDAISRKKVLNTLFYNSDNNCEVVLNKELQDRIKSLPPVKPARKKGKWIDIMVGYMPVQACDQCNTFYLLAYTGGGYRYCPNCGAEMESKE